MDINELLDKELTLDVPEYGTLKITPREFLNRRDELSKCMEGDGFYCLLDQILHRNDIGDFGLKENFLLAIEEMKNTNVIYLLIKYILDSKSAPKCGFSEGIALPKTLAFGIESAEEYKMHALWYWKKKCKGKFANEDIQRHT